MSSLNNGNFIWNIADDVLRDVYVRGKYRDVILPMTVIRRLDAVLEPTKEAVLRMKGQLDRAGVANQHAALCQASGQAFYNTSSFRLRDLASRGKQQQLRADFEAFLDGFSPNVQEVLDKFKFRNQIPTLIEAGALGFLIEKFIDSSINLSPKPVLHQDGSVRLPGLDNHSMGTIFETEQSKIFPNAAFGYRKVTVERPLRLESIDPERACTAKEIKALKEKAGRSETAPPVIKKILRKGTEPVRGLFASTVKGKPVVVEYEPDTKLRDTEQISLLEESCLLVDHNGKQKCKNPISHLKKCVRFAKAWA